MTDPLRTYLTVQRRFDAELNRVLERAARDVSARIKRLPVWIGGEVRAAQLRLVLREIRTVQSSMWSSGVKGVVLRGRSDAMKAAEDAAETLTRVLYTALPPRVAETVRDGLEAAARSGLASDAARVPRELSRRVFHNAALANGHVEATIRSGLIQGLSARELAADVYKFISPTTPGGASYAANRLARTEINNAFHQRQIKAADRPGVVGVKWNLSGSHKKPDVCNQYAAKNRYDPDEVPDKPHPHCFCFLTYDTMSPEEFASALRNGEFDDEIDRRLITA
jgi:hypothetical protein